MFITSNVLCNSVVHTYIADAHCVIHYEQACNINLSVVILVLIYQNVKMILQHCGGMMIVISHYLLALLNMVMYNVGCILVGWLAVFMDVFLLL